MSLKCGWGFADMTPKKNVYLYGQYYNRMSEKVHSELKVSALVIEKDGRELIMLNMDIANIYGYVVREFKKYMKSEMPEVNCDNLIINATHTHSAPNVNYGGQRMDWWPEDEARQVAEESIEFKDLAFAAMKDAIEQAIANKQQSSIATAFTKVTVGHCRRAVYNEEYAEMYGDTTRDEFTGMEGVEDSGVELMFFYDQNKKPTGVIVNVACPSQIMEATYSLSSDFAGKCRELLKKRYGDDFQMIYQISAAGCQSPRDLTRALERNRDFWSAPGVEKVGSDLFAAVCAELDKVQDLDTDPVLKLDKFELSLPLRVPSEQQIADAKRALNDLYATMPEAEAFAAFCKMTHDNEKVTGRPGPYDTKLHHFVKIKNNQAVLNRAQELKSKKDVDIEVSVARLGNCAFATNPFELYLDYGQRIKARSKAAQTFVIQLANGAEGYLPSARAERLGGYGGEIINGTTGHEGGKILCDETVKSINKMFGE